MRGAAAAGADVLDLGLVGTEMVYFAVGSLGLEGGVDGHRLAQPEGVHRHEARPARRAAGRRRVRPPRRARPGARSDDVHRAAATRGSSRRTTSGPRTSIACSRSSTWRRSSRCKVVIDAANGMAGAMLPPVLERLPIEAVRCYFEPDGSFPNHEPNPLLPENREFIVRKTLEEGADLGVAFDGDADRCFFVDDTRRVRPRRLRRPRSSPRAVLAKEPGAKIIYDVRASRAVPETIERAGGVRS